MMPAKGIDKQDVLKAIEGLVVHDHLCLIYETRQEQFASVIPFIRIGLERGEKCVYIVDDNTAASVLDAMRQGGIDTDAAVSSGALVIVTKREAYLREGFFDPDLMIGFLKDATEGAKREGFSALRVTGEMTWALGDDPGAQRLIEYEAKLNYVFPHIDALAICQYNRGRFEPEIILDVIKTHPLIIYGNLVCRNLFYVPPDDFLTPGHPGREVDRMLKGILERERSEKELKESEESHRLLLGTLQEGIWVIKDSVTTFVNPRMAEMLGYTVEEMTGRKVAAFICEEGAAALERGLERNRSGIRETLEFEFFRRKDGKRLYALVGAAPLADEKGNYAGGVAAITDITERRSAEEELKKYKEHLEELVEERTAELEKRSEMLVKEIAERAQAEEALRTSEEKYRIVSENTYDWEFWIDPDGRYLYVSPSCKDISGRGPEEFMADPTLRSRIISPEDRPAFERHLAEQEKRIASEVEYRIARPDGTIRWIGHACQPVYDADGRFLGTRGSNRDITDRRLSDEKVRSSEEKYRTLFDSMLNGFALHEIIVDENGAPCDYRFLEANRSFEELTGLKREDIIGKTVLEVLPGTEHYWIEVYGGVALTGKPIRFENYSRELDKYYEVAAYSPRKGMFASVFADITERRRAENALKKAKEELEEKVKERTAELITANESLQKEIAVRMETEEQLRTTLAALALSNKDLEQFAYMASHDLQEPLRMVSSFMRLLETNYRGKLDEKADMYIHYAVDGANRMSMLINDLLLYSRVTTTGRSFEPVDTNAVFETVLQNLKIAIEESGAQIACGPLPSVRADGSQLVQLLQNLIGNAIKFGKRGEAPKVYVSAELRGDEWVFSVRDEGIGIDPKYRERVFALFQRLHGREYKGTGIGLAVCKRIVERHKGRIWVESEPGKGANFLFTIPVR